MFNLIKWVGKLFDGGRKKPSSVIEPVGGINGFLYAKAYEYAEQGYLIRRMGWIAKTWYLAYNKQTKCLDLYDSRGLAESGWKPRKADVVSCDWQTCGRVKSNG